MTAPPLAARALDLAVGRRLLCGKLDLEIRSGECWAILGGNGVGKSTLLHTLAGLRPAQGGQVLLRGDDIAGLRRREVARRLGLLPQDSIDPFPSSVLETALIGRHPYLGRWDGETEADRALARGALAAMALEGFEARRTDTLSGGERRRLAMATLLTQDPPLMLLDEPTNHLDLHQQITLLQRLRALADGGRGVLMALHDLNLAARFCDHVLLLFGNGEWQGGSAAALLTPDLLTRLYGHPIETLHSADGRAAFVAR